MLITCPLPHDTGDSSDPSMKAPVTNLSHHYQSKVPGCKDCLFVRSLQLRIDSLQVLSLDGLRGLAWKPGPWSAVIRKQTLLVHFIWPGAV